MTEIKCFKSDWQSHQQNFDFELVQPAQQVRLLPVFQALSTHHFDFQFLAVDFYFQPHREDLKIHPQCLQNADQNADVDVVDIEELGVGVIEL